MKNALVQINSRLNEKSRIHDYLSKYDIVTRLHSRDVQLQMIYINIESISDVFM